MGEVFKVVHCILHKYYLIIIEVLVVCVGDTVSCWEYYGLVLVNKIIFSAK